MSHPPQKIPQKIDKEIFALHRVTNAILPSKNSRLQYSNFPCTKIWKHREIFEDTSARQLLFSLFLGG
jgi:hypothetical protein